MIQRDLIAGASATAPRRVVTYYVAISDNIFHRMRFPKFLVAVREDFGEEVNSLTYNSTAGLVWTYSNCIRKECQEPQCLITHLRIDPLIYALNNIVHFLFAEFLISLEFIRL